MRVADWIIGSLYNCGLEKVFGVTGGAVVHLFDAASKNKKIDITFFNHEQSAAFAAEAYTKLTGDIALCLVTTGPGATNALTGLSAAWLDSIPVFFISGQARSNNIIAGRNLRQVGTQEIDIIPVVKSLTNYSNQVTNINQIKPKLISALKSRLSGRPGPVWLDIPVDILWSEFQEPLLTHGEIIINSSSNMDELKQVLRKYLSLSSKPLLLLGGGCRTPILEKLPELLEKIDIPFVTTWLGFDLIELSAKNHLGHVGMAGHRGANLAIGSCDLLIVIGSSISTSVTTTKPENFAHKAIKININIEKKDFEHTQNFFHYNIQETALNALKTIESVKQKTINPDWISFRDLCKYLTYNETPPSNKFIHPFSIFRSLEELTEENEVFVSDGGGTTVYSSFQSLRPKKNQRLILSTGLCSMGSGIPEAIGVAKSGLNTYLFCGDGSFPFNIQELQLIKNQELPILITVFSNNAYLSIRSTQNEFLEGKQIGSTPKDVHLIDIQKITMGFELEYVKIDSLNQFKKIIKSWSKKPLVIEIETDPNQRIQPRQSFKKVPGGFQPQPLTRMAPPCEEKTQNKINFLLSKLNNSLKKEIVLTESQKLLIKEENANSSNLKDEFHNLRNLIFNKIGINKIPYLKVIGFNNLEFINFLFRDFKDIDISSYIFKNSFEYKNIIEELLAEFSKNSKYNLPIFAINCFSFLNQKEVIELLKLIEKNSAKTSYITLQSWGSSYEKKIIDNSTHNYVTILNRSEWIKILNSINYSGFFSFTSFK